MPDTDKCPNCGAPSPASAGQERPMLCAACLASGARIAPVAAGAQAGAASPSPFIPVVAPPPGNASAQFAVPAPTPTAPKIESPSAMLRAPQPPAGYELLGLLGRGGMGVVYKAKQLATGRIVALKTLFVGGTPEPQDSDGLRSEAAQLSRLNHPNIVAIYDVGEHQDRPYMALEFIGGGSLEDLMARGMLPVRKSVEIIESLARAVHAVHKQGVIHRDLKPGNILLADDGTPKITDFGLAKYLESRNSTTRTGIVKGTPNYMSPEQATGNSKHVGPYTDVYGLGAMLYEMLTGKPPFDGPNALATILQVAAEEPVAPCKLNPALPVDLETIVLKCMSKQPADRYASAELLADDLKRFLDGVPVTARPASSIQKLRGWMSRNTGTISIILAAAAAAVIAAGVIVWLSRSGRI